MPRHKRAESGSRPLLPGFVRYKEASGTTLYHSHYYPPTKGLAQDMTTHSLSSSELGTVVGSDDPPNTGPLLGTSFGASDSGSEDEYSDDDRRDHTYGDHDHDHTLESQEAVVVTSLHHSD